MGPFNLIIQYPKPWKKSINGVLNIGKDGFAYFYSGDGGSDSKQIAQMQKVRIEEAAGDGILLSGIEWVGTKYRLQEWWLIYVKCKKEDGHGD